MIDLARYFIDEEVLDSTALGEWRWLLGGRAFEPYRVTYLGDVFLLDPGGRVHFLDTVGGTLTPFAGSEAEFDAKLRDRHVRQRYLATFLVRDLADAGVALRPGECYSPDHPPVLGGTLTRGNLRPTSLPVHLSLMGQIHRQVKELPPGSTIRAVTPQ